MHSTYIFCIKHIIKLRMYSVDVVNEGYYYVGGRTRYEGSCLWSIDSYDLSWMCYSSTSENNRSVIECCPQQ